MVLAGKVLCSDSVLVLTTNLTFYKQHRLFAITFCAQTRYFKDLFLTAQLASLSLLRPTEGLIFALVAKNHASVDTKIDILTVQI